MHNYMKTLIGTAAVAALGLVALTTTAHYARAQAAAAAQPAAKKKEVKDTGEYDIYNDVIKDAQPTANNPKKFIADLDSWTQKYPDTDFKDVRTMYYVQAYAANQDFGKSLDAAKPLIDKGIDGLKAGLDTDPNVLQTLFLTARSAGALAATGNPTPDQIATGTKAAQMLSDFAKVYFAKDKKPANLSDADWATGLKQVDDQARGTLFQIAVAPGLGIIKPGKTPATCASAEQAFKKAMNDYPDSGWLANQIASVDLCQQSASPEKTQQALYYFARAASLPAGGIGGLDANGQKTLDDYLKKTYTIFHGSEDGLAQLKDMAAKSPNPPADFKIKTAAEIATEAAAEFQAKNPQLAMWMNIKGQLAGPNGEQYFEGSMKGTALAGENGAKLLKGTLLEAKPACRPKELIVAVPLPGAQGSPNPEITLRVVDDQDKPVALTGKPETGGEITFNGAPTAFSKEPFMLTMDSQKTDLDGLNMTPCAAAPPKKAPVAAPKKKD